MMIGTDSSFLWSNEGPIRFADHKDGEIVDARREADASWGGVRVTACDVVPTASDNVWIREKEHFSPKVIITPGGKTVLDFGQIYRRIHRVYRHGEGRAGGVPALWGDAG